LDVVILHRGRSNGPKFSHFSAGLWSPPQVSKLNAKLKPGRYAHLGHRLELFAYSVHDEPDLVAGSLQLLKDAIMTQLPASAFQRAHLFDFGLNQHLFSFP
jgi:hypothetical protein